MMKVGFLEKRRQGSHKGRRVAPDDSRSPMRRLLEGGLRRGGVVEVEYDQQWRTLFKAIRMGYVDEENHTLTEAGKTFLATKEISASTT